MKTALALAISLLALTTARAEPDPWAVSLCRIESMVPPEAADFMRRNAMCNHWGGEEPYDDERRAQIERAVAELRCNDLDRDEAALRDGYADRPIILASIDRAKEEIAWPACKDGAPLQDAGA